MSQSKAEYILQRKNDIIVPRILLAIHQANMSTIIVFLYSDGLVEYRDRTSMEILSQDMRDQFSTLGQIGFDTSLKRPCELPLEFFSLNPKLHNYEGCI